MVVREPSSIPLFCVLLIFRDESCQTELPGRIRSPGKFRDYRGSVGPLPLSGYENMSIPSGLSRVTSLVEQKERASSEFGVLRKVVEPLLLSDSSPRDFWRPISERISTLK